MRNMNLAVMAAALSAAAIGASWHGGPARLHSPGLPPGFGGKRRYRRLVGVDGCWRPGREHLPTGTESRQVARRNARLAWKRNGRPTFAQMEREASR